MLYLYLLSGFVLLLIGGESLVRGAVALARRLGVSPMVIGLTLVGFGTSMPELVTCVQAALVGSPGVAIGNVVGSNIANILLILGVAAALRAVVCDPQSFRRDGTIMAIATVIAVALAFTGEIGRLAGASLFLILVAYTIAALVMEKRRNGASGKLYSAEAEVFEGPPMSALVAAVMTVGGMAVTILGANLLVEGAIGVARQAGVSEAVIGLSVVALGTSLPELATAVVASLRGQGDVAFGNVIGSNIYNLLGILGLTAVVTPLGVPPEILQVDIWVMFGVTALAILFAMTGLRITRVEGVVLMLGYAGYIGFLAVSAGVLT